jgi:hypothetical protein
MAAPGVQMSAQEQMAAPPSRPRRACRHTVDGSLLAEREGVGARGEQVDGRAGQERVVAVVTEQSVIASAAKQGNRDQGLIAPIELIGRAR